MMLGLSGLIGSGKDTVANYIITEYRYQKIAFADSVKDVLSSIFGWQRELLNGDTVESREWRETVDTWWASKLGIENFTPRWALQNIGTDLFRVHFNNDIWALSLEKKILSYEYRDNLIITDCRFLNELNMLKKINAKFIKIIRDDPEWMHLIIKYKETKNEKYLHILESQKHRSEWEWLLFEYDGVIYNNSDLNTLYQDIDEQLRKF